MFLYDRLGRLFRILAQGTARTSPRETRLSRRRVLGMTVAGARNLAAAALGGALISGRAAASTPPGTASSLVTLLTDAEVSRLADMHRSMEAIERALAIQSSGTLVAPPRHSVHFGDLGRLVFTIGGAAEGYPLAGFRVYDTFGQGDVEHAQIVAVWNSQSAELQGLIVGERLGEVRTGAIGGVAIRLMARADARIAGIIGSGAQARTQLAAAAAARTLDEIRVYSRTPENRSRFAEEMSACLDLPVIPVSSGRAAVRNADIVILATTSGTPVIEASWLKRGAHVNTIGPKFKGSQELELDVAQVAALIATDSLEQADDYRPAFFLKDTPHMARMTDLAGLWEKRAGFTRDPDAITLFCSVGLAGTEVFVADEFLARAQGREPIAAAAMR